MSLIRQPRGIWMMTARARAYLTVAAVRHALIGVFALLMPLSFQSSSFLPLLDVAPLWVWGVLSVATGALSAAAAVQGGLNIARAALMLSATLTAVVAASLLIAVFTGQLSSPTGPIIWVAVALKDFIQCGDPLRSPFEVLESRMRALDIEDE